MCNPFFRCNNFLGFENLLGIGPASNNPEKILKRWNLSEGFWSGEVEA